MHACLLRSQFRHSFIFSSVEQDLIISLEQRLLDCNSSKDLIVLHNHKLASDEDTLRGLIYVLTQNHAVKFSAPLIEEKDSGARFFQTVCERTQPNSKVVWEISTRSVHWAGFISLHRVQTTWHVPIANDASEFGFHFNQGQLELVRSKLKVNTSSLGGYKNLYDYIEGQLGKALHSL